MTPKVKFEFGSIDPVTRRPHSSQGDPPTQNQEPPALIRTEEAARILSIGRTLAYRLKGEGAFESVRIGGCSLIVRQSVYDFIDQQVEAQRNDHA